MADILELFKKAVEICMPDIRKFYRVVRKARIEKTYASDGKYFADVQPFRNDESVDEKEPLITGVEIPVIWAGVSRGIVCPPAVGSFCDLSYYDGDPNYPRISNFRWYGNGAPSAAIDEFIIQQQDGVFIRIKSDSDIEITTTGNLNVTINGKTTIKSNGTIELDGGSGAPTGIITQQCICAFTGKPHSDYSGNITGSY